MVFINRYYRAILDIQFFANYKNEGYPESAVKIKSCHGDYAETVSIQ